jgi:HAD superfamily hydrolase (TIGR01509 family)
LPNHDRVTLFQAAIFDCDGLLADTETPDFDAWRTLYTEHGLTLDLADWAQTIGIAKGHDVRDWHAALAEVVGVGYEREAVQARRRAHYQSAIISLTPMPGVVALLDALDAEGIPCAVASNSERVWVDRVLTITGLLGRFAAIATADEVEHPKPAPDVYLLAAERLGVPAPNCAAFEDSPRGLAAAHAAGMFTVAVPTMLTRHLNFAQAHHIVESLERLTVSSLRSGLDLRKPD